MRILYHHRTLGDGAEGIHISSMIDAWRALGHEVQVSAPIGTETNVSTPRTRGLARLRRLTPHGMYECLELGYNVLGYRMLARRLQQWGPDVMYERHILFNCAGLAAARRTRIPFVLEVNAPLTLERTRYERLRLAGAARRLEVYLWRHANQVVTVSTPLKDHLVLHGVDPDRIQVLPNATDPAVFHPDPAARHAIRHRFGFPEAAIVIGFSGILRPWHGLDLLLQSAARLLRGPRPIRVLIVGDGPSRPELTRLAAALHIEKETVFAGRVPHAEIPRHLCAFDIGVSPRATFYASPMKVPEYMATGLAVVAPRMPNLLDLITDGVTGRLFEPERVDSLAAILADLIGTPEARGALGRAATAEIRAHRTWAHNARAVLSRLQGEPWNASSGPPRSSCCTSMSGTRSS
jgi:glycosyltransferase involved in cell wall biosynthesis